MKAVFEVEFADQQQARKILGILGKKDETKKTILKIKQSGKKLIASIEARDFPGLRARATTLLRDLKAILDSIKFVSQQLKKKALK